MKRFLSVFSIILAFGGAGLASPVVIAIATSTSAPPNAVNGLSTAFYALAPSVPGTMANAMSLTQSMTPTATFFTSTPSYSVLNTNPFAGAGSSLPLMSFVGASGYDCSGNCSASTADSFFVMSGFLFVPSAMTVNFELASDDGSILTIAGQQIINDDGDHSMATVYTQAVTFGQAGYYSLTLQYFQDAGGEGLALWEDPTGGTNFAPISSENLVTDPPVPEPASFILFGSALFAVGIVRYRYSLKPAIN